jgi:hypothetical protein
MRIVVLLVANAVVFLLFWAFVGFSLVDQDSLSLSVLDQLDGNPVSIERRLATMRAQMLTAGSAAIGVAAVLGVVWLVMLQLDPPIGDKTARTKRGSWAVLWIVGVVAALASGWLLLVGAPISAELADGVPFKAAAAAAFLATIGYWVGTGLGAPTTCKVAVPGFGR